MTTVQQNDQDRVFVRPFGMSVEQAEARQEQLRADFNDPQRIERLDAHFKEQFGENYFKRQHGDDDGPEGALV